MIQISIIIPTFNRSLLLYKTLTRVLRQNFPKSLYEIIVVDDGSKDNTQKLVTNLRKEYKNLAYVYQKHKGRAVAKNLGIDISRGKLIIFLDDDILVNEQFISEHVKYYKKYDQITVGPIEMPKEFLESNFIKYISSGTFVKSADSLKKPFFHTTANLSISRNVLGEECFDESFSLYGYEDLDLGYRLFKKGVKTFINKNAKGVHIHKYSLANFCENKYQAGQNLVRIIKKYPDLKNYLYYPSKITLHLLPLLSPIILILKPIPDGLIPPRVYKIIVGYYYLKGTRKALLKKI